MKNADNQSIGGPIPSSIGSRLGVPPPDKETVTALEDQESDDLPDLGESEGVDESEKNDQKSTKKRLVNVLPRKNRTRMPDAPLSGELDKTPAVSGVSVDEDIVATLTSQEAASNVGSAKELVKVKKKTTVMMKRKKKSHDSLDASAKTSEEETKSLETSSSSKVEEEVQQPPAVEVDPMPKNEGEIPKPSSSNDKPMKKTSKKSLPQSPTVDKPIKHVVQEQIPRKEQLENLYQESHDTVNSALEKVRSELAEARKQWSEDRKKRQEEIKKIRQDVDQLLKRK